MGWPGMQCRIETCDPFGKLNELDTLTFGNVGQNIIVGSTDPLVNGKSWGVVNEYGHDSQGNPVWARVTSDAYFGGPQSYDLIHSSDGLITATVSDSGVQEVAEAPLMFNSVDQNWNARARRFLPRVAALAGGFATGLAVAQFLEVPLAAASTVMAVSYVGKGVIDYLATQDEDPNPGPTWIAREPIQT